MNVKIISVGKPDKIYLPIIEKYISKCRKYNKIKHINTRNVKIKDQNQRLKREEELILKYMDEGFYCVLDEKGKTMNSGEFAGFVKKRILNQKDLYFIIGGAAGLPENIKSKANALTRLSGFTLQHDIALTVLLEQIYRAFTIIKGIPYHK